VPKASRLRWEIVLSLSRPGVLHRCVKVSLRGRDIHLCARCLGLYPALLVGLVANLWSARSGTPSLPQWVELAIRLIVPIVGASGWGVEQAGVPLPKPVRVVSGALLGVGVGWVLGIHLRAPYPAALFELAAGLGLVVVLALLARWSRDLGEAEELVAEGGDGRKKTDDNGQNEVDPRAS